MCIRDSSSLGQVCIKGATVGETLAPGRLRQPLFRPTLEDNFAPISWDDALNKITSQIQASVARRGNADGIAMYGSGQFHTEDYYLAQKLLKGALGTNNFDANSRLCMSSAVAGYTRSLGSDGPPCSYEDLDHCTVAFLIGTTTAVPSRRWFTPIDQRLSTFSRRWNRAATSRRRFSGMLQNRATRLGVQRAATSKKAS